MLGMLIVTFMFGCVVGAIASDMLRWRRERRAGQNLLRALDAGTLYYGSSRRAAPLERDSNGSA